MGARSLSISLFVTSLAVVALAAPAAAHKSYPTDDGKFIVTIGDQNEPMYTWKWTGLDLIVRDNATGAPVEGAEGTLSATLIAPGGEELSTPLEPQFRSPGRYQFAEGYIYTQPGLYKLRIEGNVNGSTINGVFEMPGPREAMSDFTFPDEDVKDLLALQQENEQLRQQVADLEERMMMMEQHMDAMMQSGMDDEEDDSESPVPAAGPLLTLGALGAALAVVHLRRRD